MTLVLGLPVLLEVPWQAEGPVALAARLAANSVLLPAVIPQTSSVGHPEVASATNDVFGPIVLDESCLADEVSVAPSTALPIAIVLVVLVIFPKPAFTGLAIHDQTIERILLRALWCVWNS